MNIKHLCILSPIGYTASVTKNDTFTIFYQIPQKGDFLINYFQSETRLSPTDKGFIAYTIAHTCSFLQRCFPPGLGISSANIYLDGGNLPLLFNIGLEQFTHDSTSPQFLYTLTSHDFESQLQELHRIDPFYFSNFLIELATDAPDLYVAENDLVPMPFFRVGRHSSVHHRIFSALGTFTKNVQSNGPLFNLIVSLQSPNRLSRPSFPEILTALSTDAFLENTDIATLKANIAVLNETNAARIQHGRDLFAQASSAVTQNSNLFDELIDLHFPQVDFLFAQQLLPKDPKEVPSAECLGFLQNSADNGHSISQFLYANALELNYPRNKNTAAQYYLISVLNGVKKARVNLALLISKGNCLCNIQFEPEKLLESCLDEIPLARVHYGWLLSRRSLDEGIAFLRRRDTFWQRSAKILVAKLLDQQGKKEECLKILSKLLNQRAKSPELIPEILYLGARYADENEKEPMLKAALQQAKAMGNMSVVAKAAAQLGSQFFEAIEKNDIENAKERKKYIQESAGLNHPHGLYLKAKVLYMESMGNGTKMDFREILLLLGKAALQGHQPAARYFISLVEENGLKPPERISIGDIQQIAFTATPPFAFYNV